MTCTSEENEIYDKFQRERDGKIKLIEMTYKQKIDSLKENPIKKERYMRGSPKRKSAFSSLYKPLAFRYGEANNRRTGYEPSRTNIDSKNDSGKM